MTAAAPPARPVPAAAAPARSGLVAAAVVVTDAAWASAFLVIRGGRDAFQPGVPALGRLVISSAALNAALLARGVWVPRRARSGAWSWCAQ